jgi:hypothetical protein
MPETLSPDDIELIDRRLEALIRDLQQRRPNMLRSELVAVMRERLPRLGLRSVKVKDVGGLIG